MPAIGIVVEAQTLQGTARIATLGRGEIGSLSGLGSTPTAQYVSAADAGKLVTTAPMTAGNVVQLVGISKNDTTLVPVSYYVNV